jgi:hypothetical protein
MMPDAKHWRGVGAVLRALHQIDPTIADPFSPLPPRPPGMWHKKYERLAQAVTVTQQRFLRSLVGAYHHSVGLDVNAPLARRLILSVVLRPRFKS